MSLCLSIDQAHYGHKEGEDQEIDQNNTEEQFPPGESKIDVEEYGIPVPELIRQIHGNGSDYSLYNKGIHQEGVGKPSRLESGAYHIIHRTDQEYPCSIAPSK